MNKNHPAFARLPKRLAISFPLWGIFGTQGAQAPAFNDLDRFVREHKERGFNCIRLDSGAGFVHDINGNRRGEVEIFPNAFGEYSEVIRQQGEIYGKGGKCDLYKSLIELFRAAKKYDVYIILSSWYYLHTFWFHPENDSLCEELFAIPPHERFMAFARFLDYIINELEEQKLDDMIAFAEIFNEADGLSFVNGYGGENGANDEELARFREEHEKALDYLQKKHPQILFAFDSYTSWTDIRQVPENMQIYNFHNYYLWGIYGDILNENPQLLKGVVTEADVRKSREGLLAAKDDWYERVAIYNDVDEEKLDEFEMLLEEKLNEKFDAYLAAVDNNFEHIRENMANFDVPVVCGEGVSYIASKKLLWEEKSEKYWELVERAMDKYKEFGLWGTVIRTCSGPEDPSWDMCAEKLKYLNERFLK